MAASTYGPFEQHAMRAGKFHSNLFKVIEYIYGNMPKLALKINYHRLTRVVELRWRLLVEER